MLREFSYFLKWYFSIPQICLNIFRNTICKYLHIICSKLYEISSIRISAWGKTKTTQLFVLFKTCNHKTRLSKTATVPHEDIWQQFCIQRIALRFENWDFTATLRQLIAILSVKLSTGECHLTLFMISPHHVRYRCHYLNQYPMLLEPILGVLYRPQAIVGS